MLTAYQLLVSTLLERGYVLQPLVDFMQNRENRSVILRHDMDRLPENAPKTAGLEHEMGVEATYYFRAMPASWDGGIIRGVASFGHEVGYHYENLSEISQKSEVRGQRTEERGKDEHPTSNIQHPTSNERMKQKTEATPVKCASLSLTCPS